MKCTCWQLKSTVYIELTTASLITMCLRTEHAIIIAHAECIIMSFSAQCLGGNLISRLLKFCILHKLLHIMLQIYLPLVFQQNNPVIANINMTASGPLQALPSVAMMVCNVFLLRVHTTDALAKWYNVGVWFISASIFFFNRRIAKCISAPAFTTYWLRIELFLDPESSIAILIYRGTTLRPG